MAEFGGGSDLYIASYCLSYTNSGSNLGNTYEAPYNYEYWSTEAQSFLAGSYNFYCSEVEVFQLTQ